MDIQTLLIRTMLFIHDTIVPFIFTLAFFFFIFNAFRYFILEGGNAGNKDKGTLGGPAKAKQLMIWGITAFVIMVSIWAIVEMFVNSFGIDTEYPIIPDYLEETSGGGGGGGGGNCVPILGGFEWCS